MHTFKSFAVFTAVAVLLAAPASAQGVDKSIIGKWKISKMLDSAEISALDDAQAEKLVGKVLNIHADKIQFAGTTCPDPNFEVERGETYQYFARRANASADNLGLPNPVTAIHVDCTYVYKKAPDRLVVLWQGVFFDAMHLKQ